MKYLHFPRRLLKNVQKGLLELFGGHWAPVASEYGSHLIAAKCMASIETIQ